MDIKETKRQELQRLVKAWETGLIEHILYKAYIYDLSKEHIDEIEEHIHYIKEFREELRQLESDIADKCKCHLMTKELGY